MSFIVDKENCSDGDKMNPIITELGLIDTSERTVEVNVMIQLARCIRENTKRDPLIIAPTQNQEKKLGFDQLVDSLPSGRLVVLQFKRPHRYNGDSFSKFHIQDEQHRLLRGKYVFPNMAFYVFPPFPSVADVEAHKGDFLEFTYVADIHDLPLLPLYSRSRTVRAVNASPTDKLSDLSKPLQYQIERTSVIKPGGLLQLHDGDRKYQNIAAYFAAADFCRLMGGRKLGFPVPSSKTERGILVNYIRDIKQAMDSGSPLPEVPEVLRELEVYPKIETLPKGKVSVGIKADDISNDDTKAGHSNSINRGRVYIHLPD